MTYDKLIGETVLLYDKVQRQIKKVVVTAHTQHRVRVNPVVNNTISEVAFGFRKCDVMILPDDQRIYDRVVKEIHAWNVAENNLNMAVLDHNYGVN